MSGRFGGIYACLNYYFLISISILPSRVAECINYYYRDHNLTQGQAKDVCQQFRFLAVKLSQVDSLYDLKIIYKAITIFAHRIADFQHRERKYSMEREIRKRILDKLGTCIAIENNFQRRLSFINYSQSTEIDNKCLPSSW